MHFDRGGDGKTVVDVGNTVLLFAIYLVLVIALPVALSSLIGFRSLPRGTGCPNCAQDTLPLLSVPLRAVGRIHPGFSLQRRWCPTCEWDGYARALAPARASVVTDSTIHQRQQLRTTRSAAARGVSCWNHGGSVGAFMAAFCSSVHRASCGVAYRLREVISG